MPPRRSRQCDGTTAKVPEANSFTEESAFASRKHVISRCESRRLFSRSAHKPLRESGSRNWRRSIILGTNTAALTRTARYNRPIANSVTTPSQAPIHQSKPKGWGWRLTNSSMRYPAAQRGLSANAPSRTLDRSGDTKKTPIGQTMATSKVTQTAAAILRRLRLTHIASAIPALVARAPCTRMVIMSKPASRSRSPSGCPVCWRLSSLKAAWTLASLRSPVYSCLDVAPEGLVVVIMTALVPGPTKSSTPMTG